MNILIADKQKFFIQNGILKDKIIANIFNKKSHLCIEDCHFYNYDPRVVMVIVQEIGYLCHWNDTHTIVVFKVNNKCKARLYKSDRIVETFQFNSDDNISYFSILMDYYEFIDELSYYSIYSKDIREFYDFVSSTRGSDRSSSHNSSGNKSDDDTNWASCS